MMRRTVLAFCVCAIVLFPVTLHANNQTYRFSGGKFVAGNLVGTNIEVTAAPLASSGATLAFSCPVSSYGASTYQINWSCKGGAISVVSGDKSLLFTGQFVSGTMVLTASGGGKGSRTTDSYLFDGEFSGIVTDHGITQRVYGAVSQLVQSSTIVGAGGAPVTSGSFGWNSAYSPLLVGDNAKGRIIASDNITGANLATYGSQGSGTGQFTTISGITEDAAGRIYILDSGANRVVRIDDLTGRNWVEIGSYGTGADHFNGPSGIAVDTTGKIWVADTGNNRIVRFDTMNGTNWTSFGSAGSGTNQFNHPGAIALDSQGIIYVADTGNNRAVRFNDLKGTGWISLSEVSGTTSAFLTAPQAIAIGPGGKVYIALGGASPALIQTTFPTGSGSMMSAWSNPILSISVDTGGTIYVAGKFSPGLAQMNDAALTGYFASALNTAMLQPGAVFARPSNVVPPAAPVFSASALNFGNHNIGEPSSVYSLVLTNLGAASLAVDALSTSADFSITNKCSGSLTGGASCTVGVQFNPKTTGPRPSELVLSSNGVHPSLSVALSGVGTKPNAVVLPAALSFVSQTIGSSSNTSEVTLSNTGSGPLTIASITVSGQFTESNNCAKVIPVSGGCTINVSFHPTTAGTQTGVLTISDDAVSSGAKQAVSLSGQGTSAKAEIELSPESLQFPDQQVGVKSNKQIITLTNLLASTLMLGKPTIPADFTATSTCGVSLIKGATCSFSVYFTPTAPGPISGALVVPITGQPTLSIGLSGTGSAAGKAAMLKFNPGSVSFGALAVGEDSVQTITITNSSGLPVAIQSSAFSATSGLTLKQNTCPSILAGMGTCSISIQFVPNSNTNSYSGTFTVVEGSGAKTVVTITGQAIPSSN